VPVEVNVSDCVVDVPTEMLPKARLVALTLSVGIAAFNCRVKVFETPPALPVSVAVCAVETAETDAEKPALVAPAATVTEAGTATAELLLAKPTVNPPVAAAAFSVTVHASDCDPVMDEFVHESPVNTGTPVPPRVTVVEDAESLTRESWPDATPALVGSNPTVRVVDCPGLRVTGKLIPDRLKPAPVNVAELMVTSAAPVEVRVSNCVTGVLTATLPKATLAALTLRPGEATPNSRGKPTEVPSALAVNVTACGLETAPIVAEKLALVAPAATVTDAGTVTNELLLARFTVNPPLSAASFSVTLQGSLPEPSIEAFVQEIALRDGGGVAAAPIPLRPTTAVPLVAESLLIVSCPVADPEAVGLNCTLKL